MTSCAEKPSTKWLHWVALIVCSVATAFLMTRLHVNGAAFLGPMVAGLGFALAGSPIRLPTSSTGVSQSVIGCVLARALDWNLIEFAAHNALAILVVVVATTLASGIIAWALFRFTDIDRDSAAWGSIPGAGAVMVAFAAEFGGDTRMVAFMQFARAILVISTVAMVLSLIGGSPHGAVAPPRHLPLRSALMGPDVAITLLIAAVGYGLSRIVRLPAGALLIPTAIGSILHVEGLATLEVPTLLQGIAVGLVGAYVGLQFDRAVMASAVRNFPAILTGIVSLMVVCAGLGLSLSWLLGIDRLTGYLATSPGGIDSIAVLGLTSSADMSIVMAVQTIRFFGVILLAPWLVSLIHRRMMVPEDGR